LVYPCEIGDLYSSGIQTEPNRFRFDYMIKSRSIDLLIPYGNLVISPTDLIDGIKKAWYSKNNWLNITQIDVKLGDFDFYTSSFMKYFKIYKEILIKLKQI
jgi:hypothetical protein